MFLFVAGAKTPGESVTLAPRKQSLTSRQWLPVLTLPFFPGTPSPAPARSHADAACENDSDLLPIIVDVTFSHLPERTQLTQNCSKKEKKKKSCYFCDNALALAILPVAGLVSCCVFLTVVSHISTN